MKAYSEQQVKEIERRLFGPEFGIKSKNAMALAGKAIADTVSEKFKIDSRIAVVCGHGNNGGDGFCAAALLAANGYSCDVFFNLEKTDRLSAESKHFYEICNNLQIVSAIPSSLEGYDCIIDAVLGIGIVGQLKSDVTAIIDLINKSGSFIISADIPSGLVSDGPVENKNIVSADQTITMGVPKVNCMLYPGKKYTGELKIADIFFHSPAVESSDYIAEIINEDSQFLLNMKSSSDDANKYTKGHLLIIGGFDGMEGAAILAARSAYMSGSGLVSIATTSTARKIIAGVIPEVMTTDLSDDINASYLTDYFLSKRISSVIIGPGMGRTPFAERVFDSFIEASNKAAIRSVVDGDALFFLASSDKKINNHETVLTPHVGECARLLGKQSEEIAKDLLSSSSSVSEKYNSVTVLKGASSVISQNKTARILSGGNSALATAGSGDVLSGIIGAFLLKKTISSFDAASIGSFVHFKSGEHAAKMHHTRIIMASEIAESIRNVIHSDRIK